MDKSNAPILIVIFILAGLIVYSLFGGEINFNSYFNLGTAEAAVTERAENVAQKKKAPKDYGKPALLYFYGPRCMACREFNPYWDKIVSRFGSSYRCVKINGDDAKNVRLMMEFSIRIYPTVYIADPSFDYKQNLRIQSIRRMEEIYDALDGYLVKRERKIENGS